MAAYQVLSWHGIPTGVRAKADGEDKRQNLPLRFQAAVDAAATNTGNIGTKAYLAGWGWSEPQQMDGTASEVALAMAAQLENDYPPEKVKQLRLEIEAQLRPG
jgi:hypothetical protein